MCRLLADQISHLLAHTVAVPPNKDRRTEILLLDSTFHSQIFAATRKAGLPAYHRASKLSSELRSAHLGKVEKVI